MVVSCILSNETISKVSSKEKHLHRVNPSFFDQAFVPVVTALQRWQHSEASKSTPLFSLFIIVTAGSELILPWNLHRLFISPVDESNWFAKIQVGQVVCSSYLHQNTTPLNPHLQQHPSFLGLRQTVDLASKQEPLVDPVHLGYKLIEHFLCFQK